MTFAMPHLLVVDSDPPPLVSSLQSAELTISACTSMEQAIELARQYPPDVALVDLCLADAAGLQAFDRLREEWPYLPIIVTAPYSRTDLAIESIQRGAHDYLVKPVPASHLRGVVARAIEVTRISSAEKTKANAVLSADDAVMIGQSTAMQEVYKAIGRVASEDVAVLILGESGTGKEPVARAVWSYSGRRDAPFVAINCAAIPEALLESELFGCEKGAFTGAEQRRIGKFEFARGGTVFLDEIADMSSATQAKILRVIQEQCFERLGGTETVHTDVRVIAATNKNLPQMVADGTFRQDLYYRVNGFAIDLPPLRRRHGDIALLTHHFIERFNREMNQRVRAISPDALHWLQLHSWPGNVRELQSTIKYAMIKAGGDAITLGDLPPNSATENPGSGTTAVPRFPAVASLARELLQSNPGNVYRQMAAIVDGIAIQEALSYAKGNQLQAAALLGISRTTLRAKLRGLGLSIEKQLLFDGDAP
jgi:two-component system nitrogen regulation response regulator GlnG